MTFSDPLASYTSAHEAYIRSTLEAEWNHLGSRLGDLGSGPNGTDTRNVEGWSRDPPGGANEIFWSHGDHCGI